MKTAVGIKAGRIFCGGYTDTRMYLLRKTDGQLIYQSDSVGKEDPIRFMDLASAPFGRRTLVSWGNRSIARVVLLDEEGQCLFSKVYAAPYAFVRFNKTGKAFSIQTDNGLEIFKEGELL